MLRSALLGAAALVISLLPAAGDGSRGAALDAQCDFVRGNVTNETGLDVVDLNDASDLLAFLFLGTRGSVPECPDAADINDNGIVEIGDYLYLLSFLFHDGPPPPPPFPGRGEDPTPGVTVPDERDERFVFSIGSSIGFPSHTGLDIPLKISTQAPIEGLQMAFEYDGNALRIDEFRLEDTALADFSDRSYIIYQFNNRAGPSNAGLSALLNADPPLSSQTIPAGDNQLVGVIVAGVQITAQPQTTQLRFADGVIFPSGGDFSDDRLAPVHNFVVVDNDVVRPVLDDNGGIVEIKIAFIRADANQDRRIDISDSIFLLSYLFYGGKHPECDDAADVNNDTKVDISDAIFLLGYLFRGGPQPPAPYPLPGLDPEVNNADGSLGCEI